MSKKHELQEYSTQEGKNIQLGQAGYEHLETTGSGLVHSSEGHYIAVTALEDDCLVSILTVSTHSGGHDDLAQPLPKGTTLYGHFTRISLSRAGSSNTSVMIYKG